MVVELALGFLGGAIGFIITFFIAKTWLKKEKIMDLSEDIIGNALNMVLTDTETQKQVYSAGVLLGNGLKTGLGLQKTGGKFKMEDLVQQGIGALLQNVVGRIGNPTRPQANPQKREPKLGEGFKT